MTKRLMAAPPARDIALRITTDIAALISHIFAVVKRLQPEIVAWLLAWRWV
jgi:hypothetical protein